MTQRRDRAIEPCTELTVRERLNQVALDRDLRPSTRIAYGRCLAQLGIGLDDPVSGVTQQDVEDRLWGIANPNTRRAAAAAARSVLGFKVKIGKSVPRRYDLPTEQDLRFSLVTTEYEPRALLAMYCGLRLGESCSITRDDLSGDRLRVDRQIQTLRETGQRTITRVAPTKTAEADVVIPGWLAERVRGIDWTDRPDPVREGVRRAFERCGIQGMTFHGLRHWYATESLKRGVPLITLSRSLRHSTVQQTISTYLDVDDSEAIHRAFG